jgi:hypothetical protein
MGIGFGLRKPLLAALLLFAGIALTAATPTPRDGAAPDVAEQVRSTASARRPIAPTVPSPPPP